MNRNLVVKRHYAEYPAFKFWDGDPEPVPVALLPLDSERSLDRPNAPLLPEIRPLPEDFLLEVGCEPILRHTGNIPHLGQKSASSG